MTEKVIPPQPIVRSKRDSAIIVYANWRRTKKISPAFKCLMTLLLRDKIKDGQEATEKGKEADDSKTDLSTLAEGSLRL
jgi:hypothetical protein